MFWDRHICNEDGSTLVLVFIMMITLILAAGWLALEAKTDTKIVASEKNYTQTLNLADGALDLAVYTLRNKYRPSIDDLTWNPLKQSGNDNSKMYTPYDYLEGSPVTLSDTIHNISFESQVYWLGYSDEAPPGFQIDAAGSHKSYTWQYECAGESQLVSALHDFPAHISALLLIVSYQ